MSKTADKIRTFVDKNPDMTQAQVAKRLGVSDRTVRRALADKSGQESGQLSGQKADTVSGFEADKKADKCPDIDPSLSRPPRPVRENKSKPTQEELKAEQRYLRDLFESERATPGVESFCEADADYFNARRDDLTLEKMSQLGVWLISHPETRILDLLDKFDGLSVRELLAMKHNFFSGKWYDAQEHQCTPEAYQLGFEIYLQESVAAKAPWIKLSKPGATK